MYHPRYKSCFSINLVAGQHSAYIITGIIIDNSNNDWLVMMSFDGAVFRPQSRTFMVIQCETRSESMDFSKYKGIMVTLELNDFNKLL